MEKMIYEFSKEGDDLNIHDMQQLWYENQVGTSYLRQGNYRLALKNFNFVKEHLKTIYCDQYDFHYFALRKYSLTYYFQMISMQNKLYSYKYATKAGTGLLRTLNQVRKV